MNRKPIIAILLVVGLFGIIKFFVSNPKTKNANKVSSTQLETEIPTQKLSSKASSAHNSSVISNRDQALQSKVKNPALRDEPILKPIAQTGAKALDLESIEKAAKAQKVKPVDPVAKKSFLQSQRVF